MGNEGRDGDITPGDIAGLLSESPPNLPTGASKQQPESKGEISRYEAIFRLVVGSSKTQAYNLELIMGHYELLKSFLGKYQRNNRVVKGCRMLIHILNLEALFLALVNAGQRKQKPAYLSGARLRSELGYLEKRIKQLGGEYDEVHKPYAENLKLAYTSLKERLEKAGKPYLEEDVLKSAEFALENDETGSVGRDSKPRARRRN